MKALLFVLLLKVVHAAECPATRILSYAFGCAEKGWAQLPASLKNYRNVTTEQSCGAACLADKRCASFRYRKDAHVCNLYTRKLESMQFTSEVVVPGLYFSRSCYSTDCNEIATCKSPLSDCREVSDYYYWTFYACGYGVTANFADKYEIHEHAIANGTSLSNCKRADACFESVPGGAPFNFFYHIPTQTWRCQWSIEVQRYETDLHDQHINSKTLSSVNESVGASFAYYYSDVYYYPD